MCKVFFVKNFEWYHCCGSGVIIILVCPVSICLKLLSCVTGADILKKVFITDGADGGACVQQDPIWIYNVIFWSIVCCLCHSESHMR